MSSGDPPSRRQVLGLVGAGVAAVVTGGAVAWRAASTGDDVAIPTHALEGPSTTTSSTVLEASTTTSTTAQAADEVLGVYQPVRREVFTDAKMVGVRAVEALMLYSASERHLDPVRRAIGAATPALAESTLLAASESLFVPGTDSVARVVYPQLGGLSTHADPSSGSIMVVVDQLLRRGDTESVVSRCVDVRVHLVEEAWQVEGIEDTSGEPVDRPDELTDEALRVLGHADISMPDSVRWDIYDGIVHRRILEQMAQIADQVPIGVTTCMRGHPINVFGTPDRSAHNVGRAVDIWAIDDRPVVQQRDDITSVAYSLCRDIYDERRVERLGSPWRFGPGDGRSWTDPVHQDHVHLGVSG